MLAELKFVKMIKLDKMYELMYNSDDDKTNRK